MNPTSTNSQDATVALTADVSQFMESLDKALSAYKTFAQRTEEAAAKAAEKQQSYLKKSLDNIKGQLKSIGEKSDKITGYAGFSLTAQLAEMTSDLGKRALEWASGVGAVNKQLERAAELNAKILDAQMKRLAAGAEMTAARGAGSESAMLAALQEELARQQRELGGKQSTKAEKDRRVALLDDPTNLETTQLYLARGLEKAKETAKKEAEAAASSLTAVEERIKAIQAEMRRIENPLTDPAKIAKVGEMVAEFDRARQMIGLSEEQAKRLQLQLDGFAPEQVERTMSAFRYLNEVKLEQTARDVAEEVRKQGEQYGKTANEIRLAELASKGFNERQLDRVRQEMQASEALIAQKQKEAEFQKQVDEYMKEQLKIGESGLVGAQAGGSSGAANAIAAARADTARFNNATPEQKAEMTRQQQLREQVKAVAEAQKIVGKLGELVTLFEGLGTV